MNCCPACIGMIVMHYGKDYYINGLRNSYYIGRDDVSMLGISHAVENIDFKTVDEHITSEEIAENFIAMHCALEREAFCIGS